MDADTALLKAYRRSNEKLRMHELNTAYIVALVLMPMGFTIDYVVYYEQFDELGLIRAVSVGLLLIAYFVYRQQRDTETLFWFENSWSILIVLTLCAMIFITGGIHSSYYAALNLVIIGSTFLLPLNLRGALVIFTVTVAAYLITVFIHPQNSPLGSAANIDSLFNNLYFIVLTGIIGATASYVNEKRRFTEFSLRYELDERNKELAQLDRMKSDFFANISHELRTPLTLILSPIEDMLHAEQPLDYRVIRKLNMVRDNSYRLLKLVNDLLTIVRLDERNKELECRPVDLPVLLKTIVKSMEHLAKKQDIELRVTTGIAPGVIAGNVSALEKIFINLINNAIKFTPAGGKIDVETEVTGDFLIAQVKDTGIGISEEDIPHIFERFKQVDSSATRKYPGTGLGLALVRELTMAQGGQVKVESVLNQGAVFTLTFKLIDETAWPETGLAADYPAQNHAKSTLEQLHQKADYAMHLNRPDALTLEPGAKTCTNDEQDTRANLLIIEDEPELRAYLVNTLSEDYRIYSAADGEAGLQIVKSKQPDIVLTDLMLPKIDGLQLCKTIKHKLDLRFIKVVLLTARIDEDSKLAALKNGADDFLTKPFSTVELKTRLSNIWASMQLEIDLDKQNIELSKALADLKATESRLLHSEKLNALGSLAAGLLHEVNNPLNYTLTAAQILRRDPEIKKDEDLSEMVDDIVEGMGRIKDIVRDLRTFAYPDEADKQQPFELIQTVNSAMRFTASIRENVKIKIDVPEQLVVLGSQSHIVQVLINLITNAFKAVEGKEYPQVTIRSAIEGGGAVDEPIRANVTIRDNGAGIEKDKLPRIFEPFYTTRDVGEGLGMGLSICHTIIKNHGGDIRVNSKPGEYSEFTFDLPLAGADA